MFSFRPTVEQWERLKSGRAPVSLVIQSAVVRWRRGDFVLQSNGKEEKQRIATQNIVLRADYKDVRDGEHMRRILEAHLNTPNKTLENDLKKAKKQEREIRKAYEIPFIMEDLQ